WTHFDRPEATIPGEDTTRYTANPCDDLARAITIELEREHVVAHVEFASDRHHDASCTHVLRGKLRAFYVHESRWAYGLSVYAALVWSLGAPVGESYNGFRADLELVDARDGRVLWTGSVFDADDYIEGFYYGPEWYRFGRLWEMRLREKMGEIA